MPSPKQLRDWVTLEYDSILTFVRKLSSINSWSHNKSGNLDCLYLIQKDPFIQNLKAKILFEDQAPLLRIDNDKQSDTRLLFCIHADTVYPSPTSLSETDTHLIGPGVADAKGGIAVLIWTLKALEHFHILPWSWTILITTDEEIGSPLSKSYFQQISEDYSYGFIYEPCLSNGNIIANRKGSYNGKLTSKGISAHAGRHLAKGKNAIIPLCSTIHDLMNDLSNENDLSINFGTISGGSAANQVPDHAEAIVNLRSFNTNTIHRAIEIINNKIKNDPDLKLSELSFRPSKICSDKTKYLLNLYQDSAKELGLNIQSEDSGGVCDGNFFEHFGIACIDTMGPKGEFLHSDQEQVEKESFIDRILLSVLTIRKVIQNS